ncbi:MAG: Gfo/Idh/MocA family oxidoreductase [Gemmatimonadetes bacterium]|nr:Gfo/Idh/MocA family oxidoreductase [Gemmatimonadota bacterium]
MSDSVSRRDFVGTSATLAMGAMIVPRHVLGGTGYRAPSAKLNIACVGIGGMGMNNMAQMLDENIVAVCDVDMAFVERGLDGRLKPRQGEPTPRNVMLGDAYKKAAKYTDFRVMLERQKDIEAVMVATPDHLHAPIALAAMQLGKHVYVQKPLAYSVHETRLLAKAAAANPKLATQMGNQGHSGEGTHRVREIIAAGVLGKIHEVHVWTDRPVRYWAQGIPRPRAANAQVPAANPRPQWNMGTVDNAVRAAMQANDTTPPPGMNWDLFLGPAPEIQYHPAYHPFAWRGWIDFGVGSIGDMGAHLMDAPFISLDLDYPSAITASSSPWGGGNQTPASYPMATFVQFEYPAKGKRGPVKLYWYDGGLMPPRPELLPDDQPMANPGSDGGGGVFIGEKGILFYETYGNKPRIYPESVAKKAEEVPKTLPRITVPHEVNWIQAAKGEAQASSPFSYAAPLTESMLLGIAALRAGQGRKVRYDGANMTFTNASDANQYLTRVYRSGWELR